MAAAPRLVLFGPPAIEADGALAALPLERRHQLAALLALRRGWVPRSEIAALLWPEQEAKLAYANLRKTLFRLQPQAWAVGLESQSGALRFEPASDVAAFEAALAEDRTDDALTLYRGELLSGFDDGQSEPWTQWLAFERERWRAAWRSAALARASALEPAQAAALAARLLEADPLDEAALGVQMEALARDGQTGAARQAYRRFAERLADELGIEPGAQSRALHESLLSAASARPAAPMARAAGEDGFVGRTIELQRIADLLARDECRLLCLVGPGGVGKTRLAQRTARALEERFADGALFVELEDVATPAHFARRLAERLDVRPGADALRAVTAALAGRQVLVVLDNFEPLAEHAAALIEPLLAAAPRVKLLVTSRVRLPVAAEWSMPIEGLPFPEPEDEDRADAFDAVRLFVKAAQRVEPAFSAAAEPRAIVDICRQVEGLPLAIELAAAWVRVLPCEAIAAELRQGSELLRAQDASRPARHASIEQVFEQTWQRLSGSERRALARLAVFRGGFTAEAARAVAAVSLPALGALADKSLLRKEAARLHLHPLVQQLAAAKLKDDDATAVLDAHSNHFLAWAAGHRRAMEGGQRDALRAFDPEFENFSSAWQRAATLGRTPALRGCARALLNYCDYRGRVEEGLALLRQAVDAPACQADTASWAALLAQQAHLEYRLDRYPQAQADAQRALEAARGEQGLDARLQALTVLASCALQTGRLEDARRLYRQSLDGAPPDARAHNSAATLGNLALIEKRLGNHAEALRLHHESLAQHRRIGDSAGVALCLNNLGSQYLLLHDPQAADVALREGLAICERDGLIATEGFIRSNLVDVALQQGNLDAAARHAEQGLAVARSIGNRGTACMIELQRVRVEVRRGELERARAALAEGIEGALAIDSASAKSGALLCLAELLEAQGHVGAARQVLAFAVDHPSTQPADRDELRAEWAKRAGARPVDPPWPGIELPELLQRIVAEREVAYAPLLAALRGGPA